MYDTKYKFYLVFVLVIMTACQSKKKNDQNPMLFSKDNLVAWCVVPFDSMNRTPEERAAMLSDLGFKQFAYDWRLQHLPSFPAEINALKKHNIKLKSVWMWIDIDSGKILDETNEELLKMIKDNHVETEIWLGFSNKYFEGHTDEEKLKRAIDAVQYIKRRAEESGCTISLYNHGDWFGDPVNQIRIIEKIGSRDIGIIYNYHHAHDQIKEYPELLNKMLPYLKTVNIDGMRTNGPKILPVGEGEHELQMLKTLKASGFNGSIGILGHVENNDVKVVLARNLNGLKSLLQTMGEEAALATY